MGRLEGKVAVITGVSSGFGRGIARALAAEGARVVSDIQEQPLEGGFEEDPDLTTVEAIEKDGGEAIYVGCDVTKQDQVHDLIKAAVDRFGRLDIMVNNAGIYRGGKLTHEFTEEDLDACYNVNVKGTFFGAQEAVKQFLEQGEGGNIINLVSTAGLGGHPNQSVYNTSKGAQANLTRCLAIEYGEKRIRVNGICPTYARTALTRSPVSSSSAVLS
jgi:NAD(P)-dependent dehydrogenase (short-subunit alcohol dehydrogenase family)